MDDTSPHFTCWVRTRIFIRIGLSQNSQSVFPCIYVWYNLHMNIKKYIFTLLLVPSLLFAQTGTPPSAGLTPQSPFYFIDRLGEVLQEILAFNPETRISLQIGFVAERIAEIQVDMEAKDVDAKGLGVAQERLQAHLAKASRLV